MVGFPLLLIPLAIYNIIVFLMPGVSFTDPLVKLTLMSGAEWPVTLSDVLLTLGILLLLAEVIKGARPGAKYLTDHLLSLIVFGAAAAEFVLWPKFGTSTYFLLTHAGAGGFPLRPCLAHAAPCSCGRRRPCAVQPRAAAKVEAPAAEPQPDPLRRRRTPAPAAPSVPAAASVAESVLQDHPEPKPVQPAVAPEAAPVVPEAAPQPKTPVAGSPVTGVPSPGIQPASGSQPLAGQRRTQPQR